jgi:hypothetical protein
MTRLACIFKDSGWIQELCWEKHHLEEEKGEY